MQRQPAQFASQARATGAWVEIKRADHFFHHDGGSGRFTQLKIDPGFGLEFGKGLSVTGRAR